MYLIIVGAGTVTKQLISIAKEQGHKVAAIEKDEKRARDIMQEFDVRVFHADIAEGKILEEADVKSADAIIATQYCSDKHFIGGSMGTHGTWGNGELPTSLSPQFPTLSPLIVNRTVLYCHHQRRFG